MRILFLYFNVCSRGGSAGEFPGMPFSVGSLTAYLKMHAPKHQLDLFFTQDAPTPEMAKQVLEKYKPDLLAFSSTTSQFKHVSAMGKFIRERRPGIFQICGGPHVTLSPEKALRTSALDAICLGEGEHCFLEVVNQLDESKRPLDVPGIWCWKDEKEFTRNAPRPFFQDLDSLPYFDREIYAPYVDLQTYPHSVLTTRGCPYACTYCDNHALKKVSSGKYVRSRSVEHIMGEIALLREKYGAKKIYIEDEAIGLDKAIWDELLPALKKTGRQFASNYRIGQCDLSFLQRMKDANFYRVNIGVESGNEWIREHVLHRKYTNQNIRETYAEAHRLGFYTKSYNLVGIPMETTTAFADTLRINQEIKPNTTLLNAVYPHPGTRMEQMADLFRLWNKDVHDNPDFQERIDYALDSPLFPRKSVLWAVVNWNRLLRGQVKLSEGPGFGKDC